MTRTSCLKLSLAVVCCLLATFASSAQVYADNPRDHEPQYVTITNNGDRNSVKIEMLLFYPDGGGGRQPFMFRLKPGETWKSPKKFRFIKRITATMYEACSDYHPIKCEPSIKENLWTDKVSHFRFDTIHAKALCITHIGE